ncbi:MAG TPA: protein kinase [Polyangiaceae bacterium]|nr:protein kinase [Polyangiaceae bacterium]
MQCPSCQTSVDALQRFCPACGAALTLADERAERAEEDAIVGQTLGGKYKVIRLIGEGGMGAVYEGEQPLGTAKRKVAIKTLHPHLSRDPKIKARFEREVGTLAELEHPNTIQVYDFGASADGILYIVMEFLQGKSLASLLESEGAMPPLRVERIMRQIGGSLEEAHGRGIVHRDLKPDNVVLVDRAGKKDFVKVLDFGIAKRSHEVDSGEQKLTQQGMVLGTPPYMSPEQFTGRPIDARSDIYSLGVMAYEMLTGRLPFHANTAWEWATQHMTQAPIPIESLAEGLRAPEAMRRAIHRALAKAPVERFQVVGEFVEAFGGASSAQGALAVPTEAAAAPRQKTEMGAPLDASLAFGGAGASAPMGQPAVPSHTPIGSNVSFPTPGAIPQAPPREDGRGKGRGALLAAAGLILVASAGAIAFSLRGSSSGGSKAVLFDPGAAPAPATSLVPSSVAVDETTAPVPSGGTEVPPLTGGGSRSAPHPSPPHGAPPPATVAPGSGPAPGPTLGPIPAPSPPKPGRYDGPECANARKLRALGHPREAESWALACVARGGLP